MNIDRIHAELRRDPVLEAMHILAFTDLRIFMFLGDVLCGHGGGTR